jgi:hypothetical protein
VPAHRDAGFGSRAQIIGVPLPEDDLVQRRGRKSVSKNLDRCRWGMDGIDRYPGRGYRPADLEEAWPRNGLRASSLGWHI